ncbi:MAG TPA: LPS export ABC transporter permease LptG [Gammaproteobacteria bacterium]
MRRLTRYIALEVLKGIGLALAVLVAVTSFVELVGQLDDVGTNDYGFREALLYVALRLPRTVFEILPPAALIGALLSLGNMAVHRELVVMRASGVSNLQLLRAVSLAGFALLVVMVLLGESLAPSLGAYAREMRMRALHEDLIEAGESTWLKSGDRIWNLRRGQDEFGFGGVYMFDLDRDFRLERIARADFAEPGGEGEWLLTNYAATEFLGDDGVAVRHERIARERTNLSTDLLALSVVREDLLDTPALRRYIAYLEANDLDSSSYRIAYWARIANVVSVVLMTVLALPFVFGGLRSAGKGARLLAGLVIGLGYYVATQMMQSSGEVFDIDPLIVAWAPSAVLLAITAIAFLRLR